LPSDPDIHGGLKWHKVALNRNDIAEINTCAVEVKFPSTSFASYFYRRLLHSPPFHLLILSVGLFYLFVIIYKDFTPLLVEGTFSFDDPKEEEDGDDGEGSGENEGHQVTRLPKALKRSIRPHRRVRIVDLP